MSWLKMASNQSHKRYLTAQKAVDDILGSTGREEKDIAILPPAQGDAYATYVEEDDVDECHKNDLLPNDVAGILEIHNNDECEVASDVSAVQVKKQTTVKEKERECESSALEEVKLPAKNTRSKCFALS